MTPAGRHPMSAADAAWLRMDRPTNPMAINALLWFGRPLDRDRLRALLAERLVAPFPRFRQRAVEDGPGGAHWLDDPSFDLDLHVHHLALPAPGDDAALRELVGDLATRPLDRSRALWDVYLIENHGPGCALHVRMHHCIADGIALARVMLTLTDDATGAPAGPAPVAGHDGRRALPGVPAALGAAAGAARAASAALLHETLETVRRPGHAVDVAQTMARDARTVLKLVASPPDRETALHRDLSLGQRVGWSAPLPLEPIRAIAHAHGATINDVLMAALTGAVAGHLRAAGDAVDEVRALVPFNLRPLDEPLPTGLGNRFGLVLLGLPVGVESAVGRLREVRRRMRAIKASHEGPIAYGILSAMGVTPPGVQAQLVGLFSSKGTMVVTNVPGARDPVSLAGVPLERVLVWAPCSGSIGMSVSIFSYRGEVTAGFLVNRGLAVDPQPLADAFVAAVAELEAATTPGSA